MRDIIVTLIVLGSIPMILSRPFVGVIMWSWISYMNPHRLSWGFATEFPFAMLIALATMAGLLFSKENKKVPMTREIRVLLVFVLWMCMTTSVAFFPDLAWLQLTKVLKIQLFTIITLMLLTDMKRIHLLVWTIGVSLGFYGIKGGIFTITSGGGYHVFGPLGTFIGGNNELGLALLMTIPLLRYLQLQSSQWWLKMGLLGAMLISLVAILGTQSRGALLGLGAMSMFLILKSPKRGKLLAALALSVPLMLSFMPDSWWERMESIKDYKEDKSAMGRINAWGFAFNLAKDKPLVGGGFETFRRSLFKKYAPNPNDVHDAHSVYFELMGEHGFVGLGIFLLLLFLAWQSANWMIKKTRDIPDLQRARMLAQMLQVSLIGYASAGAFLGLAYFDLLYAIIAIIVAMRILVQKHLDGEAEINGTDTTVDEKTPPQNYAGNLAYWGRR